MEVSSLCTTSPCAAWRISSSSAGWSGTAVSATISHCVAAGSGMPRFSSRPSQPIPGNSAAVAQQGDHAGRRLVVLLLARAFRRCGREHVPAQIAAQLFQLIHGRGERRLPFDPHQHAGIALRIDFAAALRIRTLDLPPLTTRAEPRPCAPRDTRPRHCARARQPYSSGCCGAPGALSFFSPVSMPACFSTFSVFSVLEWHNSRRNDASVASRVLQQLGHIAQRADRGL